MKREEVIQHLNEHGCFVDPDKRNSENELFRNCVSGATCAVPNEEVIENITFVIICMDLNIDQHASLEDDYHVMCSVKDHVRSVTKNVEDDEGKQKAL